MRQTDANGPPASSTFIFFLLMIIIVYINSNKNKYILFAMHIIFWEIRPRSILAGEECDWWMHYGLRLNEPCAWGSMLLQQQPVLLLAWLYNTHMLIYLLDLESWSRWLHRVSVITSNIGLMVHIPHHYVSESNKTKPIPVISSHKCSHQGHSNFKERSSSWYTVICQAALHTLLQVNWHTNHHVTIAGI